ncbi:glutamate receptor ionotropic, delta-1-like [Penaeus vannamei]|uniref:glutamate receptor ionotropic, delta-1-like n=1 Tax=Penaeus vannamei TaxID=6689 RepID=UPI00387F69A1
MGLAELSNTYERSQVVDFTEHLVEASSFYLFPAKKLEKPVFVVFLVFTPLVWLSLAGLLLVMGASLFASHRLSEGHGPPTPSVLTCTAHAYRSIVYQSSLNPQGSAPRLVYISGLALALILYAVYNGNLTAFLSTPRLQKYPGTSEEMLEQDFSPVLVKGYVQYDFFQYSPLRTYQELFRRAVDRGNIYPFGRVTPEAILRRFRTGKEAVVMSSPGIPYFQNQGAKPNELCPFFIESNPIKSGFSHFILQKDSFFREIFNRKLMWLRDTGILKKASQDYNAIRCASKMRVDGSSRPLALEDLQGAFLILLAGVALAALSFALELAAARVKLL